MTRNIAVTELVGYEVKSAELIDKTVGHESAVIVLSPGRGIIGPKEVRLYMDEPEAYAVEENGAIRVLVADDVKEIRELIVSLLDNATIKVVGAAENGAQAVELARELHPDVVVMDVAMPVMDGPTAAAQIERDCPEVKIVFITGYSPDGATGKWPVLSKVDGVFALVEAIKAVSHGK